MFSQNRCSNTLRLISRLCGNSLLSFVKEEKGDNHVKAFGALNIVRKLDLLHRPMLICIVILKVTICNIADCWIIFPDHITLTLRVSQVVGIGCFVLLVATNLKGHRLTHCSSYSLMIIIQSSSDKGRKLSLELSVIKCCQRTIPIFRITTVVHGSHCVLFTLNNYTCKLNLPELATILYAQEMSMQWSTLVGLLHCACRGMRKHQRQD